MINKSWGLLSLELFKGIKPTTTHLAGNSNQPRMRNDEQMFWEYPTPQNKRRRYERFRQPWFQNRLGMKTWHKKLSKNVVRGHPVRWSYPKSQHSWSGPRRWWAITSVYVVIDNITKSKPHHWKPRSLEIQARSLETQAKITGKPSKIQATSLKIKIESNLNHWKSMTNHWKSKPNHGKSKWNPSKITANPNKIIAHPNQINENPSKIQARSLGIQAKSLEIQAKSKPDHWKSKENPN